MQKLPVINITMSIDVRTECGGRPDFLHDKSFIFCAATMVKGNLS